MSIAGVVAAASMGVAASSASAADVWLWACHGPNGQPVASGDHFKPAGNSRIGFADFGGGCAADAGAAPAGVTLAASAAPANGDSATVTVTLPTGLTANAVQINRTLRGFEGGRNVSYRASANGQTLDSDTAPSSGVIALNSPASNVTLELSCSVDCASTAAVDIAGVALRVTDDTAPSGGVSWNSPVDHAMSVTPSFTDSGVGLDRAELTVAGMPGATRTEYFSTTRCSELSPADATNDRPLNPDACPTGTSQGADKPLAPKSVLIKVWEDVEERDKDGNKTGRWINDPLRLPEGMFRRTVTVYDAAGNKADVVGDVEVWHPPAPVAVRELNISTSSSPDQPGSNNNNGGGGGGVQGAQRDQCRSPRLSVLMKTKPVRVTKGTPVLKYKKAYRFTGRLTCVINGKRQSAPKRTKLSILNKVGKKTVRKPNTAIRAKGAVDLKLAFVSSRTVIFRYTNAAGQKSEVKIKVSVTKKKK